MNTERVFTSHSRGLGKALLLRAFRPLREMNVPAETVRRLLFRGCRWTSLVGLIGAFSFFSLFGSGLAGEKEDVYLSFFLLGSVPEDKGVVFSGMNAAGTNLGGGFGGGLKAGIFPEFTKRTLGVELEYFGHGGNITFLVPGGGGQIGRSDLTVLNSMVNFLLRYPGNSFQPYGGVGIGYSSGILTDANIPGRADRGLETAPAFAHQWMAGLQGNLTERIFLFGEYKQFSANYHWSQLSLDFRTHYVLTGIGLRF